MNAETARLLIALKGAPLSTIHALREFGRPCGAEEIAPVTGYKLGAISSALATLVVLGLVVNTRRYNGWQLTPRALQLPLFTSGDFAGSREKSDSRGGSSNDELNIDGLNLLLLLPSHEKSDSRAEPLAQPLMKLGCPPDRALEVVTAALDDGDAPEALAERIQQWVAYCHSPEGKTITARGLLIAKRIEQNAPIPEFTRTEPDAETCTGCGLSGGLHADNCPHTE